MPFVQCPTCHATLNVPDGMSGNKAKCTICQTIFTIPATAPGEVAVKAIPVGAPGPQAPVMASPPAAAPGAVPHARPAATAPLAQAPAAPGPRMASETFK